MSTAAIMRILHTPANLHLLPDHRSWTWPAPPPDGIAAMSSWFDEPAPRVVTRAAA
jgi:hypothetical protein